MEDGNLTLQKDESTFDDLCGDATFNGEESGVTDSEVGSWGLLDGHMLARVFHYLRSDLKSLVFASLTCKHWRAAVMFYKEVSRQVNLSSLGHSCTDSMLWTIMVGCHIFSFYYQKKFHIPQHLICLFACRMVMRKTRSDLWF